MAFLAPIFGAIGSLFGAVSSFIGGLGFIGKALLGIGLNLAAQYLLRKEPKREPTGTQLQTNYGTDVPRQVACGLVGIAGHDVHVNTYGGDNKWLQWVFQISDYPLDGFSRLAINGEWATLDLDNPHPTRGWPILSGELSGRSWLKFVDGRQTAADAELIARANPSERWTAEHVGLGCAYVIYTAEYDQENPTGMPDLFFEVRGARLYDWRKDSTVGGTGGHRWNDPSTHEFSENPVVIDYNYRRGFSINGDLFCGMGMDPVDLPLDRYTSAANVSDETVNGDTRYRCSIMLDCTAVHGDNIEALMKSCGGIVIDAVEGSWPLIGTAQPIIATITDDDLVVGQPVQWQAKRSMSELVNSISGTYPDKEQLWAMVGYEAVVSNDAVAVDRRTRDLGMDFPTVRSPFQAKQLASIYLRENRFEATAEITVRPRWQALKPGDWITWNSDRYGNKTYIVVEATLLALESDAPRCKRLRLQERSATIYDGVTPPNIVVPVKPGKPVYLQQVQGLLVSAVTAGADGKYMPALQASWNTITDVTVTGVELRWYPVEEPTAVSYTSVPVDETVALMVEGIVSDTEYEVQTRLITDPQRTVVWSSPYIVRTMAQGYTDIDRDGVADIVNDVTEWFGHNTRETIEELRRNVLLDIEQDAANYRDKQQLRRELASTYGDARASWREDILVMTGPGSALALRLEELEAEIDGSISQAVEALQVQIQDVDGQVQANATAITDLSTTVSGISSSVTIRGEAMSSPGGGWARYGVQVKTGSGNEWSQAAFYMDTDGTDSRVVFTAGKFIISDGTSDATPFVFQDGTAFVENVRLGTLYFDQLMSNNGKLILTGSGANASIEVFN